MLEKNVSDRFIPRIYKEHKTLKKKKNPNNPRAKKSETFTKEGAHDKMLSIIRPWGKHKLKS